MVNDAPAPVAAVILAAGRSTRSGTQHKLLATDATGRTMIERSIAQLAASRVGQIAILLPPRDPKDEYELDVAQAGSLLHAAALRALRGLDAHRREQVTMRHVTGAGEGIAASIRAGVAFASEHGAGGLLVCLADMPLVGPDVYDGLIAAFSQEHGDATIPRHGRWGNPVLWSARLYPALMALRGDSGARALLGEPSLRIIELAADRSVLEDFDTPDRLDLFARLT